MEVSINMIGRNKKWGRRLQFSGSNNKWLEYRHLCQFLGNRVTSRFQSLWRWLFPWQSEIVFALPPSGNSLGDDKTAGGVSALALPREN